jgi:hypothetical protein
LQRKHCVDLEYFCEASFAVTHMDRGEVQDWLKIILENTGTSNKLNELYPVESLKLNLERCCGFEIYGGLHHRRALVALQISQLFNRRPEIRQDDIISRLKENLILMSTESRGYKNTGPARLFLANGMQLEKNYLTCFKRECDLDYLNEVMTERIRMFRDERENNCLRAVEGKIVQTERKTEISLAVGNIDTGIFVYISKYELDELKKIGNSELCNGDEVSFVLGISDTRLTAHGVKRRELMRNPSGSYLSDSDEDDSDDERS